jgi:hypothetical protein
MRGIMMDQRRESQLALLANFGPVVLTDFGSSPVPQPTVARLDRGTWRGLEMAQWREAGCWPACYDELWARLQGRHGKQNGTRAMVAVVALGREFGHDRLRTAVAATVMINPGMDRRPTACSSTEPIPLNRA